MIERLLSTQYSFLSTFKPQRTNLYLTEWPNIATESRGRVITPSTGIVSQLLSQNSSLGRTVNSIQSNPLSLVNIAPELPMMTNRVVLPGFEIQTMETNRLSYFMEIAKSSNTKRATFTFYVNEDLGEYRAMKAWYNLAIDDRTRRTGFWSDYAEGNNITLTTLNTYLEPKIEVTMYDCFPVNITGLEFTYEDTDGLLKFDVTFSMRDINIDTTDALSSLAEGALNRLF